MRFYVNARRVISRRLILKAIYPVANFIAYTNREEAIICGSFINAKDSFSALRLHCNLHLDSRFDSIKNTLSFEADARILRLAALALLSL